MIRDFQINKEIKRKLFNASTYDFQFKWGEEKDFRYSVFQVNRDRHTIFLHDSYDFIFPSENGIDFSEKEIQEVLEYIVSLPQYRLRDVTKPYKKISKFLTQADLY